MAPRVITFSDDEIPADGTTHTHPLSILMSCRAQIVTAVLIDNGSGLNVCTLSSVKALGFPFIRRNPREILNLCRVTQERQIGKKFLILI